MDLMTTVTSSPGSGEEAVTPAKTISRPDAGGSESFGTSWKEPLGHRHGRCLGTAGDVQGRVTDDRGLIYLGPFCKYLGDPELEGYLAGQVVLDEGILRPKEVEELARLVRRRAVPGRDQQVSVDSPSSRAPSEG